MSRTTAPTIADYQQHELARRASRVMPGGNTRTTLFVPPSPPYAVAGEGCWVEDQLGHRVIDCNNNYTALIHGHAHPAIREATAEVGSHGTAFGLPTEHEVALAELLSARTGLAQWRFSNSGSEAVMTAIRAARAFTGRDLLIRFDGSYHGTYDAVVASGSPGVPAAIAAGTIALPQGDASAFDAAIDEHGPRIAAVLVDLMPNRAGLKPADAEFVNRVRTATRRVGALLVVDEVITFRLAEGGMHRRYGIEPDLVTFGKIIGGGYPVGAVGGTVDVMAVFDPRQHEVAWGGTFSANPITTVAGLTALRAYGSDEIDRLNGMGDRLRTRLAAGGVPVSGAGSLLRVTHAGDPAQLWWDLYLAGVLAGTNGLMSLSTPMTEDDVVQIGDIITRVIERLSA